MANGELQVFEYSGTARSGKGTMVGWLGEVHPEVATDETGADYRAVTFGLLNQEKIEPDMPADVIRDVVDSMNVDELTDLAANRKDFEAEFGKEIFYASDVSSIVHHVAPSPEVRKAVKAGFSKRVERVRDDDSYGTLLVDGRNLAPVIEGIAGTRLALRTFVFCNTVEAAYRECARAGLEEGTPEWKTAFGEFHRVISERNNADANRESDPVAPDANAIIYWNNQGLLTATADHIARIMFDGDRGAAIISMFSQNRDLTAVPRIGAGYKAVAQGRQVLFDTSPFYHYDNPKHAMLLAANTMFEEAVQAHRILDSAQT